MCISLALPVCLLVALVAVETQALSTSPGYSRKSNLFHSKQSIRRLHSPSYNKRCNHNIHLFKLLMAATNTSPPDVRVALQKNNRVDQNNRIRYSDFLRLVDANLVDKVTFR